MIARVLVLGGARSGKSSYAERLLEHRPDVDYLATSFDDPDDPEWQQRLQLHRARRPASWRTLETLDVAQALVAASNRPLLIDCLTLWLTRQLDAAGSWTGQPGAAATVEARTSELVAAFAQATRPVIAVSNEVGQGLVPADAGARLFRDELGRLNARVAAVVDQVWFCTAGLPQRLK